MFDSPFLHEKLYVFTPQTTIENIKALLSSDYPYIFDNALVSHDFISWSLKQAFQDLTGCTPDGHKHDNNCFSIYQGGCKAVVETFMFSVIRELGYITTQGHLRYSIVLTYERLYIITY